MRERITTMATRRLVRIRRWMPAPAALAVALGVSLLPAQSTAERVPFTVGEELVYRASSSRFGKLGTGVMSVAGPEEVRGRQTYVLGFDFRGRMGPAVLRDQTRSWLDPRTMASLRYRKTEKSPLGSRSQAVEMHLAERHWQAADGEEGGMPTSTPLDELSFLFFLRTISLEEGTTYSLDRHFDARRNPVNIRVLERTRVSVPAGEFDVVKVEMRVKDPGRYKGEGVIRMYITDDARRIPVRIESSMPFVGSVTLALQSASPGGVAAADH